MTKTRTYGEIAEAIGSPGAARAVGSACGANPLPLFIPCHRAVAAGGKLGGFSGGLGIKKKLLAWEGVEVKT
jgi:methylated-DNA-[protein]-cysteine S-methyltransferase